ncbi:MAG: acetoacetate decarboxylase family protein [Variibacter sp.]
MKSTFKYEPGRIYMMPIQFGPQPGNRDLPGGLVRDEKNFPKRRTATIHYLTRAEQLVRIIPPGFELWGEPVITFEMNHHTEVPFLGGRGYCAFGVQHPVRYVGKRETLHGMFRSVTFEDPPDVVTSGREELGCHKLYAELPEPRMVQNAYYYNASLYGRQFFTMELHDLEEVPVAADGDRPFVSTKTYDGVKSDGTLYYKYIPRINTPGVADVAHAVLLPAAYPNLSVDKVFKSKSAKAAFIPSTWQDLPKYFHVVNALAGLDLLEFRGASLTFTHGGKDLSDMRAID